MSNLKEIEMKRTAIIIRSICICLFVINLTGCTQSAAEQFIQGKWAQGNVHYWAEWNFVNGSYWYEYDDTHTHRYQRGHYIVEESGEDFILLELVDREGDDYSLEDKVEIRITFDSSGNSLHIRQSDYIRVSSSTLKDLTTQQAP